MSRVATVVVNQTDKMLQATGLTCTELAELFNITKTAVSRWKSRNRIPVRSYQVLQNIIEGLPPETGTMYGPLLSQRLHSIKTKQINPLASFETEVLFRELQRRGWDTQWKLTGELR